MKYDTVQLMLYGSDLEEITIVSDSPGINVLKTHHPQNNQYAFVDIFITDSASIGKHALKINSENFPVDTVFFELRQRNMSAGRYQGFNCKDIIYLITPDRFVNGNPANDEIEEMRPSGSPESILGRHGGDIAGIMGKLDYLKNLGITAIWINPLIENNMPISYHGYAATDFYRIDPRFGTNSDYFELVEEAHKRDLKIIMDHVSNHIGIYHPWMSSLPDPSWINGSVADHEQNRHQKMTLFDSNADTLEIKNLQNAWFVDSMPDLNQKNEFVANYLIQNTIWWIESSGIDGIREDTYPYADLEFLARWTKKIIDEYPEFNVVGEVWIQDPVFLAPFQENSSISEPFNTNLPSVTDFGLFEAFGRVFNRDHNIYEFYNFIAKDFLYSNPNNLVTFIDNHDVMRLIDLVDGDEQRYIMALKMLFTLRGIPQIYYGTEIGLEGGPDHGEIRRNFPGGFNGDSRNGFSVEGRTEREILLYETLRQLISLRSEYPALSCGRTIHFKPENNMYVYFREYEESKMLMIVNNTSSDQEYGLARYYAYLEDWIAIRNVETGQESKIAPDLEIVVPANDVSIFELIK